MGSAKQLIGYLMIDSQEDYFRGAALVTDSRGIPSDFRYTEPVRPTKLERILYGNALDIYLREDIILDNLLGAVQTKPVIWILSDEGLIDPVQRISRLPAMVIVGSARSPLEQSGQFEPTGEEGVFMLQADNISAPFRLTVSQENVSKISQFAELLTAVAEEMELTEPFTRIQRALEAVAETETEK